MQLDRTSRDAARRPARAGGAALLCALLALLLNQALLPALHFASGAGLPAHQAAHHLCGETAPDTPDSPGHDDHQACHFCRIAGAGLPPPPCAPAGRLEPAHAVAWADTSGAAAPPRERLFANPTRGPPRTV